MSEAGHCGSLFVLKGKYRAVLINYPDRSMLAKVAAGLDRDRDGFRISTATYCEIGTHAVWRF